jgi:predicted MFS family arabinose efflux permease
MKLIKESQPTWRGVALLPTLLLIGMLVAVISSLGAPLVPDIAATQHASLATAQWSLTITLLVGAASGQVLGRLGDGPRRRLVLLGALTAVLIGSALAAIIPSIATILVGRALQGLGLGLMPVAIAIARDHLPDDRVRSTISILSVTTAAGLGVGYPLTGLVAELGGIRAALGFGAVITGLTLVLAALVIPVSHSEPRPLDTGGAIQLGLAQVALLVALSQGAVWGWSSVVVLTLGIGGLVLLGVWVRHELHSPNPLVELHLLRRGGVLAADLTALLVGASMYLLMALTTRYVQTSPAAGYGFGSSTLTAGLIMFPLAIGSVLASRIAAPIAARWGSMSVLPIGTTITALALLGWTLTRSDLSAAYCALGVGGLGMGFTFAAMPGLIVADVPASETGSANGFNQILRQLGGAIGSALSTALLEGTVSPGHPFPSDHSYTTALSVGVGICVVATAAVLAMAVANGRAPSAAPGQDPSPATLTPDARPAGPTD